MNEIKENACVPMVTVPLCRFEELIKEETMLQQIKIAVNATASYNLADVIKTVLSVLPK